MARYQLILAYDGTHFSGFQRQGKARTVQSEVEKALRDLGWNEDSILFAGRTDTGVHASGQVITFSLDWQHKEESLLSALNARLADDVSVLSIFRVEADFHPRYDASKRSYTYSIYNLAQRQPLLEKYAWRIWPALEIDALNQAAAVFIGRYDFSSFGRAMKPGSTTIREVFESHWNSTETGCSYEITANAFLYHMVRRLVYVQVQTAKGLLKVEELREALQNQILLKPGLAPSKGLSLTKVLYEEYKQGFVE